MTRRLTFAIAALACAIFPTIVGAQDEPSAEEPALDAPPPEAQEPEAQEPTYDEALMLDVAVGFVPVANDVPLILGAAVRFASVHEIFARGGYMPTGDDVSYGFGVLGYRAVLLPRELVRPVVGAYVAVLPATCTHDATGAPSCQPDAFFVFSAVGGVRIEPTRWLGLFALLSLGVDSYPNPFGMIELGATFAWPLS